MHDQIGGDETDVIPFVRAAKGSAANGADQLDKAGQTILQLLHKRPALQKKTVDTRWRRHRSSRINCARPKLGLRSWKQRSLLIGTEPSGLSSGCTVSTRRLKIDSCGRKTGAAAACNGPRDGGHKTKRGD